MVHSDRVTLDDGSAPNPTVVPLSDLGPFNLPEPIARDASEWDIFYDGDIYSFTYGELKEEGIMPGGLTWTELTARGAEWEQNFLDFLEPPATGGGGSSRAPYVRPDERLVRSAVEGAWDGLTGNVDKGGVNGAIKKFYENLHDALVGA